MREPSVDKEAGGPASITRQATSGVLWTGSYQIARQLLSILSVSVLARYVPPSAYGLIGMAAVLTNFLDTIRDLGTTSALVREPKLTDRLVSAVFWVNCMFGVLLMLIVFGLSAPVALFFHEPQLTGILRWLSVMFVLMAFSVVPNAILNRRMAFRQVALAQFAGAVASAAVSVTLAVHGEGVWSLVFGSLANHTVTAVALWIGSSWSFRWVTNWRELRPILSFSLNLSGFNVLNYFSRNADNLVVGRFLGSSPLGYYQMAYSLMTYPLANFSAVVCQVLLPGLSRVESDNARFRSAYIRTCMLISLATFPAMLGVAVTSAPLVRVMLGTRWLPVAGLLKVFGPLGMAQSVFTTIGLIYTCKGRTDRLFRWGIISGTLYVASFFAGLPWGIKGVAISYSIVWTLLMIPGFLIPFQLIELPLREFFARLWPVLKASLLMTLIAEIWLQGLYRAGLDQPAVQLFSTAAVGALCYIGVLWWWKPPVLGEVADLLEQSGNPVALKVARLLT